MKHKQGFTLIEILIALSIFAILATMTSISLHQAFETRAKINAKLTRLEALQVALTLISRDVPEMAVRSIYAGNMRYYPAIVATDHYLEFTRDGLSNPGQIEARSTLKRVGYLCRHGALWRRTWRSLDEPNRQAHFDRKLLTHLNGCHFAYLDQHNQVLSNWEALSADTQQLPRAIQLNLEFKRDGKLTMLYVVPEGAYDQI